MLKRIVSVLTLVCLALLPFSAKATGLTTEQLDYIKGALYIPRNIAVTEYDCNALDYTSRDGQRLFTVNLYSNGEILAGAIIGADTLLPENDVWEYSENRVNAANLEHQSVRAWSESDLAYLKGAFGIPWNVAAHCEVGMPYLWEAGEVWLTSVDFYAGAECHADTVQEEYLAGAAIESKCTWVSMVRDLYMYSPN